MARSTPRNVKEPPPYISYSDFPDFTPFTEQAIRAYVHRGDLKEGIHYFRHGRRVIFKWAAIEEWIEKRSGFLLAETGSTDCRDIVPIVTRRKYPRDLS